jgi:hypothetical protein
MGEGKTWVVLTDGYYIKILYFQGQDSNLNVYRDDDFEHSSDITYRLITRYRRTGADEENIGKDMPAGDSSGYLLSELSAFLSEKYGLGAFEKLLIAAPGDIMENLEARLPDDISARIIARVEGDYLQLAQDQLEALLKDVIQPDSSTGDPL